MIDTNPQSREDLLNASHLHKIAISVIEHSIHFQDLLHSKMNIAFWNLVDAYHMQDRSPSPGSCQILWEKWVISSIVDLWPILSMAIIKIKQSLYPVFMKTTKLIIISNIMMCFKRTRRLKIHWNHIQGPRRDLKLTETPDWTIFRMTKFLSVKCANTCKCANVQMS